jgi:hypothetical protein
VRKPVIDKCPGIVYDTDVNTPQIVIDTNVFIAALRSRRGASYKLFALIDSGKFVANVSVPLVLEYEDAAKRLMGQTALTARDIDHSSKTQKMIWSWNWPSARDAISSSHITNAILKEPNSSVSA